MKWTFSDLPDSIKLRENQAENLSWNLVPRPVSILCSPALEYRAQAGKLKFFGTRPNYVKIRNQPIQKRSCFWYRKLCAFNLLIWGANCCFEMLNEFRLLCCWNFICVGIIPETSRCWQHHSNYQITTRLFHILQDIPCDLFVLVF